MRIGDIAPHVVHDLIEEMKKLAMSFKGFPFHIHGHGHSGGSEQSHRDKFTIYWTTKAEHFARPERNDVVSELYCQIVGLHDNTLLLRVKALSRRLYLGQERQDKIPKHNWYRQDWREDYFLVEASASALWTIMEAHADFERAVKDVHEV